MSETTNLGLFKHDNPSTNTNLFDVQRALNDNWDKIDDLVGGELEDAKSGFDTLADVINQKIYYFNNVSEMKDSTTLIAGNVIKTLGYYQVNDGGGAHYYVRSKTNDDAENGYIIILQNNLVAELIIVNLINVKQFGAYGDGIHDDTTAIQNAINYINKTSIQTQQIVPTNPSWLRYFATSKTLYFPNAKYKIENTINFNASRYYNIDGNNSYIESVSSIAIFKFSGYGGTKSIIKNLVFNEVYNAITFDNSNLDASKVYIENCKFIGTRNIAIIYDNRSSMLTIKNCIFSWCYKIFKNIRCDNVEISDCWFSEYEASENNHTSFEVLWGENKFINCLFIPNGHYNPNVNQSSYTNLAWIQAGDNTTERENNPSLIFDKCRISSEPNSKTLINWQVIPNIITNSSDTSIKIMNCYQLASALGESVIKLWHLPQQLIIENSDLRIENNAFIKLDENLNIDTELSTYASSTNRTEYTYDYSITNCKTQTSTAWKLIPPELASFFRNTDFDIRLPISSTNNSVQINLGSQYLGTTYSFNRMYLVKAYFCPINTVAALSSVIGLIMFDAVNTTVESSASIRVKFIKLAQYGGGSSNSVNADINITPTFQNGSNIIGMSGSSQIKLNLQLNNAIYEHGDNYITIKRI